MSQNETVTAGAQNTFTDPMNVGQKNRVSISVSGTFVATVTLQRRFPSTTGDAPTSWADVESWSAGIETTYVPDENQQIRIGVKTGDYTSGSAVARIGQN